MKKSDIFSQMVVAAALGLLAPVVAILGAEPFEVRGRSSIAEMAASNVAIICYLAICQYCMAPKGEPGKAGSWSVAIAMAAPLVAWVVLIGCVEKPGVLFNQALPMLAAGCGGIAIGAVLAARRGAKKKAAA